MTTQFLYEATSLALALATGIFAYPFMNRFMRMLFFQLIVWIFFYLSGYAVTYYQETHHIQKNNTWVYNIAVPVEFLILTIAVSVFSKDKMSKYLVLSSYVIFLASIYLQMSFYKSGHFANYAMVSGSIIMTVLFVWIIYIKFTSDLPFRIYRPEVFACLGLIIYFACNVPYISIMPFLNENSPEESKSLFNNIIDNLANFRYLLLSIAFLLARINKNTTYSIT
jgi:hypothetical protein